MSKIIRHCAGIKIYSDKVLAYISVEETEVKRQSEYRVGCEPCSEQSRGAEETHSD